MLVSSRFLCGIDEHPEFLIKSQVHDPVRGIGRNGPKIFLVVSVTKANAFLPDEFAAGDKNGLSGRVVGSGESGNPRKPWWQHAWDEIRLSRGEAIQAGRQEQEIVDEQLSGILANLLTEIRQNAAISDGFSLKIPASQTLAGIVQFNQVSRVEEGFLAPDTELKVVRDLNTIEQWRA